jgi:hypothetical protein
VTLGEEELVQALENYFSDILTYRKKIIDYVIKEFLKLYRAKDENVNIQRNLLDKMVKLKKTRQKYMDMYTDDLISRQELNQKMGDLKSQLEVLENELKLVEYNLNQGDQLKDILSRTFKSIEDITAVHDMSNEQLKQIIQKIEVDHEGNVDIYLRLFEELGFEDTISINNNHTK